MKYLRKTVVMKEHPDHVSLCFEISGCPHDCPDCHSPELKLDDGMELTPTLFLRFLIMYEKMIDCVIFFGGDHDIEGMKSLLAIAKTRELKTCLWTGAEFIHPDLLNLLDYAKLGPYIKQRGPLGSPNTNQLYFNVKTGEPINV